MLNNLIKTVMVISSIMKLGVSAITPGEVVVLTKDNYEELVMQSKDIWIVEFYTTWCGHCKALEPEYKEAAKLLRG